MWILYLSCGLMSQTQSCWIKMKIFAFLSAAALPGAFGAYCHGGPKEF